MGFKGFFYSSYWEEKVEILEGKIVVLIECGGVIQGFQEERFMSSLLRKED